jgi:hypothetical protein
MRISEAFVQAFKQGRRLTESEDMRKSANSRHAPPHGAMGSESGALVGSRRPTYYGTTQAGRLASPESTTTR